MYELWVFCSAAVSEQVFSSTSSRVILAMLFLWTAEADQSITTLRNTATKYRNCLRVMCLLRRTIRFTVKLLITAERWRHFTHHTSRTTRKSQQNVKVSHLFSLYFIPVYFCWRWRIIGTLYNRIVLKTINIRHTECF